MGITEQTFYRWKRKFGILGPDARFFRPQEHGRGRVAPPRAFVSAPIDAADRALEAIEHFAQDLSACVRGSDNLAKRVCTSPSGSFKRSSPKRGECASSRCVVVRRLLIGRG